jgi:hypothetical protein
MYSPFEEAGLALVITAITSSRFDFKSSAVKDTFPIDR